MASARWYPSGQSRPLVSASSWDVLTLGGTVLPGRAKITKAAAAWKADAKRKPGADADRATLLGFDARPIGFEIEAITVEEKDEIDRVVGQYVPAPGWAAIPVTIEHDAIAHLKAIRSMIVEEVSAWTPTGKGALRLEVNGRVWVGQEKPRRDGKASKSDTPTKLPPNKRSVPANPGARPAAASSNPAPSTQAGFCAPDGTTG